MRRFVNLDTQRKSAEGKSTLILTRRIGETICIGLDIRVTILSINGHQVRVGIEAPRTTLIDREEIRERKEAGLPQLHKPLATLGDAMGNK